MTPPLQLFPDAPVLDFAGLIAHLAGGTQARIGPYVLLRQYGTDPKNPLPPVISVEWRGIALAFLRPDSVRFPGPVPLSAQAWQLLSRVVADNRLGSAVVSVHVTVAPNTRRRRAAIDGDRDRLLADSTYPVPARETETEQEIAS